MRVGIVGCGLIGGKRADALGDAHRLTIVADTLPERAASLGNRHGARSSASWQDVTSSDVDAVIVATRHDSLAEIALRAVEAGKHVLIEKPGARNAGELELVAAAATQLGRCVKVGFNHRFHPAFLKARSIVDANELGPLMFIRAHYGHGGRVGYETEWRCQFDTSGGGELIDQGIHLIDLAQWFLGKLSVNYASTPTYFWNTSVDDNCFLALSNATGNLAWLHASWTEWKNTFEFEIAGQHGKLLITGLGGSYGVERLTFYKMHPQMGPPETTGWEFPFSDRSWALEFEEFASAIEQGRRPLSDVNDTVASLRLIDSIYAGA